MLQLCKVTEGLLISNARSACSDELIQQEEVTLCINVSKQQPFPSTRVATFRVPVFDDPHEDLSRYFDRCTDAIHSEKARGGRTVVYCKNGRSRSATVCVAYLMKHQGLSLTEAFEMVKSARSVVEPNPGFWAQLELYEQELKIRRTQQTNKCLQFFQFSIQRIFSQRRHTS
ncbi:dual specificity phosphatase 28 isoform X2 [Astyanax mexicanus]|uniref:Dual specificity phosphatase 28 n=3 Tax=Astyanax mexicanus TaxID=7994 RepID=W5LIQ1_ASTMX|nr:dual specificity phosphatase 28 isoform X2 [Astyanax mexicanus]XP_007240729.1 dual specificity phosphatase 28 isoform X2 [Astyanax mexicanus]XP_022534362.1 dual specificity phosphatase 28 isoform X2 [Astyanax mexicanus]